MCVFIINENVVCYVTGYFIGSLIFSAEVIMSSVYRGSFITLLMFMILLFYFFFAMVMTQL